MSLKQALAAVRRARAAVASTCPSHQREPEAHRTAQQELQMIKLVEASLLGRLNNVRATVSEHMRQRAARDGAMRAHDERETAS